MISVGIDVSKEKSTVCVVKPCGEIIIKPFEVNHTEDELCKLSSLISRFNDEIKIVMEATGVYHLPILSYLKDQNLFVAVINPLEMKRYRCKGIRNPKTDKIDSIVVANYGIDFWYHLKDYTKSETVYSELRLLGRQYRSYMKLRVENMLGLTHMLDYTMPGIKTLFSSWNKTSGKDKLADFVDEYWHFDNITKLSEEEFIQSYNSWCKKNKYRQSEDKAKQIYEVAKDGIPTLPSSTPSTKMLVHESVKMIREIVLTLTKILSRMQEIAKELPEYNIVRAMNGVGEVIAPRLIGEIGDIRRFHGAKALVAYAGIDAPPYQSGKFTGTDRHISKRGSSTLRKVGFEAMICLKQSKPQDDAVYLFIKKKDDEGKPNKVAKIAGFNKFLHIYYARVMEVYR
ncbi:MAG: IS110 family transposase [Clostridium cadaveris]|uniref:IS110 family transposase n=1 Tax=Clostridium cadaveris TaxID=1529 RepID=A0A316M2L5_9CLOT|nr:MAG: IS110 family transposase [Clostridium cadaveris]